VASATQQVECSGKGRARVDVRWILRRDMPEVLNIEQLGFSFPWTEEDFVRCLRQRNCIGMVAESNQQVRGYMIYELHADRLHLLNFAVLPSWQRFGVGQQLIQKLVSKLSPQRRSRINCEVRESNLSALLFLKAQGFRATAVLRDFYEDTTEDAYAMQFRYVK
jgi:ribosomal-protein-alanine N-acetyltransferase